MVIDPLLFPNPKLKEKAQTVKEITPEITQLSQNMLDTMYHYKGIGLAATQIGAPHRVVVMDLDVTSEMKPVSPKVFINPEILSFSKETSVMEEGCLSVAGKNGEYIQGPVTRPTHIRMRYQDLEGIIHEEEAQDMLARCMQHEIDHLDGILFLDRLLPEDHKKAMADLQKEAITPSL